jgi:Kef-type K+ transport system membrane component KefB
MVGLIVPRDNSFAIKVTEKLEDLIGALFLPLYFTLSGLNTDLGLLDNGITWGYVIAVTLTAFFSKVIGATLAARFSGMVWRESLTIGALMSCKGLVELIVLVGQAGVMQGFMPVWDVYTDDCIDRTLACKQRFSALGLSRSSSLWPC